MEPHTKRSSHTTEPSTIINFDSNKNDAEQLAKQKQRRLSIIREFALNTSTHALPGIARSRSLKSRIFWSASLLFFTGLMVFFVARSIIQYFEYPTNTLISAVAQQTQRFPAVTICNFSPVRVDRLLPVLLNYTAANNYNLSNDTSSYTDRDLPIVRDFFIEQFNLGGYFAEESFKLESMMMTCAYNQNPCTSADFIRSTSTTYGACYTFNAHRANVANQTIRYTTDFGGTGRLEMRLYTHNHLYFPLITRDTSAALAVTIHDNQEFPTIDISAMHLAPGRKHRLGYRKRTNDVLPPPYSNCTDKISKPMQTMFEKYAPVDYTYSQEVCQMICLQTFVYNQCGCTAAYQWIARYVQPENSDQVVMAKICYYKNTCPKKAAQNLSQSSLLWSKWCGHCTQACSTTDFLITASSGAAPTYSFATAMKNFVENSSLPLPANWSTNWLKEIEKNYINLDIICESSIVESLTQEAAISGVDLLSNIGGLSGLWIGISLLSIMEFIEMLSRLVRYQFSLWMNRRKL